jgi:CDP-diacylglycerol--glycerol-3-phosphate 3-phosphatidyltransferase
MKVLPNIISLSRIMFSIILLFTKPLNISFYIVYIICGFSDIIDGYIARKTGTTSRLGEKLDSVADMVMVSILLVMLYPVINPTIPIIACIILIAIIRFASMVVAFMKYKTFVSLHTYGNKITGIILFAIPIFLLFINVDALLPIACIIASLSAIEELIIQVTSNELRVNIRGLLDKTRNIK